MRRERMKTVLLAGMTAALTMFTIAACSDETPTEQQQQADKRDATYQTLLDQYEVSDPTYSNDLVNIDFWVDTWGTEPGKLAYVYLLSADGEFIGYYVLDGLPTTKCKNATPTYELLDFPGDGDSYPDMQVPAPGLSGTYSTGTGDCTTFYGKDASTGAYVEWTVTELTMLTFDQPYPMPEGVNPPALGFTEL
jgi:hypothetical protein